MNPGSIAARAPRLMHDVVPPYAADMPSPTPNPAPAPQPMPTPPPAAPAPAPVPQAAPVPTPAAEPPQGGTGIVENIPVAQPKDPVDTPMFPAAAPPAAPAEAEVPAQDSAPAAPAEAAAPQTFTSASQTQAAALHKPRMNWVVIGVAIVVAIVLAIGAYLAMSSSS